MTGLNFSATLAFQHPAILRFSAFYFKPMTQRTVGLNFLHVMLVSTLLMLQVKGFLFQIHESPELLVVTDMNRTADHTSNVICISVSSR